MATKQIKLKVTLTHLNNYAGGAEKFLNDLKTAYASIMRIVDKQTESDVFSFGLAFFPQDDPNHFYSGETDDCQKLNQLNSLTIYRVESNLIPDTPIAPKSIKQTKNDKDTENIIINDSEEIATLKLEFFNLDNTVYNMPDNATIDGNELEISFLEAASHTITFTNTTHSEFDIDLPLPINVPDGENILLPSVSGQFEDEDYIYTPSQWDIGEFGESIYPTQDMTADLMWNREEIQETLPTVTIDGNLLLYTNADSVSSTTIQPNASVALYSQGSQYPFPANTTIACKSITFINVSGDKPIVEVWNNNGIAYLKNIGKTEASVKNIMPAFCNSSNADVVTVYNSNNVALYAFKYNLSGTDYYYVLTNSQTDWTDDLASIGYYLTPFEEVTLNLKSGNKNVQPNITSSYTDNPSTSYLYQLYNSNGYDFEYDVSKTYEVGYYDGSGTWIKLPTSVSELPASTSDTEKTAYIFQDTSKIWLCSNSSSPSPVTQNSITVRIRQSEQQIYAFYTNTGELYYNGTYSYNTNTNRGDLYIFGTPILNSKHYIVPWDSSENGFPTRNIIKILGSAGNEIDKTNIDWTDSYSMHIKINQTESVKFRSVLFSLDKPTFKGYLTTITSGTVCLSTSNPINLTDKSGNPIPYEAGATYKVIGVFDITNVTKGFIGNSAVEALWLLNCISIVNNNGVAQATISSDFVWANYLWITKTA